MNKIAKFEKVSFEQFLNDIPLNLEITEKDAKTVYDSIKLPQRATSGSAGHDFYVPFSLTLKAGQTALIPTGIRCKMNSDYVLNIYPRSSLGFKYRLQLDNSVGIIDSDYYNSKNQGHIMVKITNDSRENKEVTLIMGDAFCQGIFTQYGVADFEEVIRSRDGGFGSTDSKELHMCKNENDKENNKIISQKIKHFEYPSNMDKECIAICDFFNSIGLETVFSCCGHNVEQFNIVFSNKVKTENIVEFLDLISQNYDHTPLIGYFSMWVRKYKNKMISNWMYTVPKFNDKSPIDYAQLDLRNMIKETFCED